MPFFFCSQILRIWISFSEIWVINENWQFFLPRIVKNLIFNTNDIYLHKIKWFSGSIHSLTSFTPLLVVSLSIQFDQWGSHIPINLLPPNRFKFLLLLLARNFFFSFLTHTLIGTLCWLALIIRKELNFFYLFAVCSNSGIRDDGYPSCTGVIILCSIISWWK